MRVTKVKVVVDGKKESILLSRDSLKGSLYFESTPQKDCTKIILPAKKKESFTLSILNQTLVKDVRKDKSLHAVLCDLKKLITKILHDEKDLPKINTKDLSIEHIKQCVTNKFKNEVTYFNGTQTRTFNLPALLVKYAHDGDGTHLQPYAEWKNWYIKIKSSLLIKSIENNKIDIERYSSKRQQALKCWEPDFLQRKKIDLTDFHNSYDIDTVISAFNSIPFIEYKNKTFEFCRLLKKELQKHQSIVFGPRENPNMKNREDVRLQSFHAELVKYMEHYFPVKKSDKHKRNITTDYVAVYLKADTIKNTIRNQLENALRMSLLQNNKFKYHGITTSKQLTKLKRNEAFVLNLFGSVAFAANTIRNIIDPDQPNDILVKNDFKESLEKNSFDDILFSCIYNISTENLTEDEKQKTIWALRGSVQKIRNEITHYKKEAIEKVFKIAAYEFPSEESPESAFCNTVFKKSLEQELADIPQLLCEKFVSGGAVDFYPIDEIATVIKESHISLCNSSAAFAPGFKKVFARGVNYQLSNHTYKLDTSFYFKKASQEMQGQIKSDNARYFLLKQMYNTFFLPHFTHSDNKTDFFAAVEFVLDTNKKHAQNGKNPKHFAFAEIRRMNNNESVQEYMSYIQSSLIQEQQKKDSTDTEKRMHFEDFLIQVFIKGFDSFLSKNKFNFINSPSAVPDEKQHLENEKKLLDVLKNREIILSIDCNKDSHIAFYTFCKLLDTSYLSSLRNERIKYNQSVTGEEEKLKCDYVLEIIELCLLSADKVKGNLQFNISPFFNQPFSPEHFGELYVQSAKKTPVVHSAVVLMKKYGTYSLLTKLFSKHLIYESHYEQWSAKKEKIADKVRRRDILHKEWIQKGSKSFDSNNKSDYKKLCNEIDEFNALDNSLKLVNVKRLHNLLIEILARMAGFIALRDRDNEYNKANKRNQNKSDTKSQDNKDSRNYIAHFNYLTRNATKSLIEMINLLRDLLLYDRKLKNAVSKSFIDMFAKHGMLLTLRLNTEHKLEIADVKPKKIFHLGSSEGKDEIITFQVSADFCSLCKDMLNYKT